MTSAGTRKWFLTDAANRTLHHVSHLGAVRTRCGIRLEPGYSVATELQPKLSARDAGKRKCSACKRALVGRFE